MILVKIKLCMFWILCRLELVFIRMALFKKKQNKES